MSSDLTNFIFWGADEHWLRNEPDSFMTHGTCWIMPVKGERKRILREAWGKFQKAMKRADRREELTCIAQTAESEWEKMMTAKEASKKNK